MSAHKHWRVNFSASTGRQYIEIRECAFRDASLNDLSVDGTPYASSNFSGAYDAAKAFDKSTAAAPAWTNVINTFPCSLGYRTPAPVDPAYVDLDISTYSIYLPSGDITCSWSDDGLSWSGPSPNMSIVSGSVTTGALLRLAIAGPWTDPPPIPVRMIDVAHHGDYVHGGNGRAYGSVKEDDAPTDLPLRRQVVLHRQPDGLAIRSTWSDAVTGDFSFEGISLAYKYYAVVFDYTGTYTALVRDNLTPEVMA